MALHQAQFKKLKELAKSQNKIIKRSERLEVGAGSHGLGSLRVYFMPSGAIRLYYGYKDGLGKQDDFPIGIFADSRNQVEQGVTFTLAMARQRALELSNKQLEAVRSGMRSFRELPDMLTPKVKKEAQDISLKALLELYAVLKEEEGRIEYAKAIRAAFRLYLFNKPIAKTDAARIKTSELASIFRVIIESGKRRTYQKLRSYLLAAYNLAIDADDDEMCDSRLVPFGVTSIPIAKTRKTGALVVGRRTRYLNEHELRIVWGELLSLRNPVSRFLQIKLLTRQRTIQLLRVKRDDINFENKTMMLYDPKGRRQEPRRHVVALNDDVWNLIVCFLRVPDDGKGLLFCFDDGREIKQDVASNHAKRLSIKLLKAGVIKENFTLGDFRRTWETHMARLNVSKEIRGQIASHGISGVQDNHYDMYDYLDQKREAAVIWSNEINRLIHS